jgi:hypothetical protein
VQEEPSQRDLGFGEQLPWEDWAAGSLQSMGSFPAHLSFTCHYESYSTFGAKKYGARFPECRWKYRWEEKSKRNREPRTAAVSGQAVT